MKQNKKQFIAFLAPIALVLILSTLIAFSFDKTHINEKYSEAKKVHNNKAKTIEASFTKAPNDLKKDFSEKGLKLIEKKLMKPLEKVPAIEIDMTEQFSRCPSGLGHYLVNSPKSSKGYFIGEVEYYSGCMGTFICQFRVNYNETEVSILDETSNTFISVDEWIENNEEQISPQEQTTIDG